MVRKNNSDRINGQLQLVVQVLLRLRLGLPLLMLRLLRMHPLLLILQVHVGRRTTIGVLIQQAVRNPVKLGIKLGNGGFNAHSWDVDRLSITGVCWKHN